MAFVYTPIFDPDAAILNMNRFNVDVSTGLIKPASPDATSPPFSRKGQKDFYLGINLVYDAVPVK
jgi:hypothetical protein